MPRQCGRAVVHGKIDVFGSPAGAKEEHTSLRKGAISEGRSNLEIGPSEQIKYGLVKQPGRDLSGRVVWAVVNIPSCITEHRQAMIGSGHGEPVIKSFAGEIQK